MSSRSSNRRPTEPTLPTPSTSTSRKPPSPSHIPRTRTNSSDAPPKPRTRTGSGPNPTNAKHPTPGPPLSKPPTRTQSASAVPPRAPPVPPRAPTRKQSSLLSSPTSISTASTSPTSPTTRKKPSLSSPSPVMGTVVPCTTLPRAPLRSPSSTASLGPSTRGPRRPTTSPLPSPGPQATAPISIPPSTTNARASPTSSPHTDTRGMFKRLLAKPSPIYFSGSDSDRPKRTWTSEEDNPRRRAITDVDEISEHGLIDFHLSSLGLASGVDGARRESLDTDIEAITRTRAAVLRRAKGESLVPIPSPTAPTITTTSTSTATAVPSRLPISPHRSLSATARISTPSLRPPARAGSTTSSRTSSPSPSPSRALSPPKRSTLTPASALVEAYKKQEKEREEEEKRRKEEREEMRRQSQVLEMRLEKAVREEEEARERERELERERGRVIEKEIEKEKSLSQLNVLKPKHSRPSTSSSIPQHDDMRRFALGNTTTTTTQVPLHSRLYSSSTNTSSSQLSMPISRVESRMWEGKGFEVIERMHGTQDQDPNPPPSPSPSRSKSHPPLTPKSQDSKEDGEEDATPYYTVFGSSSGRVVAAGSPRDWDTRNWDATVLRSTATTDKEKEKDKDKDKDKDRTVLRTLSRKVSGHWRRAQDEDRGRGRTSLQEKRVIHKTSRREMSVSAAKVGSLETDVEEERRKILSRRRSLRLSIDKCSSPVRSESEHGHMYAIRKGNASGSGSSKALCESDEEDYGTPVRKLVKPRRDKEDRDKAKATGSGGNKLWKLMKRISTGGLRDKYQQQQQEDFPPVPALPKEYEQRNGSRSSEGTGGPLSSLSHAHTQIQTSPHQTQSNSPSNPRSPPSSSSGVPSPSSSSAYPSPPTLPPISAGSSGGALSRLYSRSSTSSATSPPVSLSHHAASRKTSLSAIRVPSTSFPSSPTSPVVGEGPIASSRVPSGGVQATAAAAPRRQSTTTRSSSPMSSDVASSRFFNRTMSTRSSTSSAEEVPPLPKPAFVGHHIIPPSELGKDDMTPLVDVGAKKAHPRLGQLHLPSPSLNIPPRLGLGREDDWMIVDTPAVELTSLPFPPRRPRAMVSKSEMEDETEVVEKDMERERDRPASPEIPSFSTAGAINAFPRRGSSGSSLKVSSPTSPQSTSLPAIIPPRPPRSMERPAPQPQSQTPDESGSAQAQIISMGRKSESAVSPNHHRHSSGSTMRPWRRSSSFGSKSQSKVPSTPTRPSTAVPSSSSSRLTFRELSSSGKKYALTEKEKADIWDDLLERSDRAGGTLHLGAAEDLLMSDKLSMRMSVASEVPSSL